MHSYFNFLHPIISAMLTNIICRRINITVTYPIIIHTFSLSLLLLLSFLEEGRLVVVGREVSGLFSISDASSPGLDKQQ